MRKMKMGPQYLSAFTCGACFASGWSVNLTSTIEQQKARAPPQSFFFYLPCISPGTSLRALFQEHPPLAPWIFSSTACAPTPACR
ncbi:MAG: hypothetical protein C0624_05340 [Desulfuromonas sp.]|nr:MAG: hypothetical protein C0624_05340 [Desulfuromonas sp.]